MKENEIESHIRQDTVWQRPSWPLGRWPNGARSIYVRDPAGNSLEFAEPALWA